MDKNKCFLIRREEFLILEINTYMYMHYHACVLVIRFDSWSINHILKCILCIPPLFLFATCLLCKLLGPPYLDQFLVVANETVRKKTWSDNSNVHPFATILKWERERESLCRKFTKKSQNIKSEKGVQIYGHLQCLTHTILVLLITDTVSPSCEY